MWLVDLNYSFECDWLIELFDNKLSDKLSDNNLTREVVEELFKPIAIDEIVTLMIKRIISFVKLYLYLFQFAVCTEDQLDKNDYCPNWAAKGYCSGIYEQFMQTTCYASCGNCEGKKILKERMKVRYLIPIQDLFQR